MGKFEECLKYVVVKAKPESHRRVTIILCKFWIRYYFLLANVTYYITLKIQFCHCSWHRLHTDDDDDCKQKTLFSIHCGRTLLVHLTKMSLTLILKYPQPFCNPFENSLCRAHHILTNPVFKLPKVCCPLCAPISFVLYLVIRGRQVAPLDEVHREQGIFLVNIFGEKNTVRNTD